MRHLKLFYWAKYARRTVSTALSAAETGHLILSALHTVGAVNTIDCIIDMFQDHQDQVRSQLSMILEATLVSN